MTGPENTLKSLIRVIIPRSHREHRLGLGLQHVQGVEHQGLGQGHQGQRRAVILAKVTARQPEEGRNGTQLDRQPRGRDLSIGEKWKILVFF